MVKSFAQNLRYFRANFFLRTFALFLSMKRNFAKTVKGNFARNDFCEWLRKLLFFAQNWCAKKEKFCVSFRKNCATVLRMETLGRGRGYLSNFMCIFYSNSPTVIFSAVPWTTAMLNLFIWNLRFKTITWMQCHNSRGGGVTGHLPPTKTFPLRVW